MDVTLRVSYCENITHSKTQDPYRPQPALKLTAQHEQMYMSRRLKWK